MDGEYFSSPTFSSRCVYISEFSSFIKYLQGTQWNEKKNRLLLVVQMTAKTLFFLWLELKG